MSRNVAVIYLILFSVLIWSGPTAGQCILANPSFELPGSDGNVFGGWNQFGVTGSSSDAVHGSVSARLQGLNWGGWDVSGYWQRFDAAPGERWYAAVKGWHIQSAPLTGGSQAILNIEWRNSSDDLISYESYTVADASTPAGEVQDFSVTSGAAPSGTASVRLLLGVLQDPGTSPPVVLYDLAEFYNTGPPDIDDIQWNDFPGGRTLDFSGKTWRVKGPGYLGPGPNLFSDDPSDVWVDDQGRLHLTVSKSGSSWYSTEVTTQDALGYGDYRFTTLGRLDTLDPSVVLGMFLWQYGPCYDSSYLWWNPYNEIDVEFSRWGDPGAWVAQFVAQPYDYPGNISRFDASFSEGERTTHAFHWTSDSVEYRSWRGGPYDESFASMISTWTYTGPHIPRPEQPRIHLNLWRCCGEPSADQEVIFENFMFVPEGATTDSKLPSPVSRLLGAVPNPFNPTTRIRYMLERESTVSISVYDIEGRFIRDLLAGRMPAGEHEVVWDGRNEAGITVSSGVYFCRFSSEGDIETIKVVLLR